MSTMITSTKTQALLPSHTNTPPGLHTHFNAADDLGPRQRTGTSLRSITTNTPGKTLSHRRRSECVTGSGTESVKSEDIESAIHGRLELIMGPSNAPIWIPKGVD